MSGLKAPRPLDVLFPLLALALLLPILLQYERPVQDRDFGSLGDGSADFANYYLGSLALSRGFDPYLSGRPEFRDPFGREIVMDGVIVTHYYLPGHYIAFAPLTWIYGFDWDRAARAYFWLHLALLVFLAWIVATGARGRGVLPAPDRKGGMWLLWALMLILFGLHVGVRLGLERGQSDVIQAVLFWGGIVCAAGGQMGVAAFLFVAGTSMKGYGAILVLGLGLSLIGKHGFRAYLVGALAAGLPILGVTWPYVSTSLRVALYRAQDFSYHWTIHGFKHVGWAMGPQLADPVRYLLLLTSLAAAILCWNRYREALASGREESTLRLVIAATVSIATMLGFGSASETYNLVLLLPGLVWIADLVRGEGTPISGHREALFASAFLLIVLRTPPFRLFSPAAYGLVLLVIWCLMSVRRGAHGSAMARHQVRET